MSNTTQELTDDDLNKVVGGYSKTKTTKSEPRKSDRKVLSDKTKDKIILWEETETI